MSRFGEGRRSRLAGALLGVAVAAGLLAGCGVRPGPEALAVTDVAVPGAREHVILVASTRSRDPKPGTFYSGERDAALSFARIDLSIPPSHKPGVVEWPKSSPPNPATEMVVREAAYRDTEQEFLRDLHAELALRPAGQKKAFIFVHGYNTLFSEALYRLGQMTDDSKNQAVPILFTWASRGAATDYVYDNNSATAARDRLEETVRLVFDSGAEEVSILAHSMGNWVTVEALRQIQISGRRLPLEKLGNIVLAAPDIDVDVFKTQLKRFGKPAKPFIVIVSRDDKALELSEFIAGGKGRLGAYTNDAELVDLGAVVVDMTKVKASDEFNHGKFAQLAEMAPQLRGMIIRATTEGAAPGTLDIAGMQVVGLDRVNRANAAKLLPEAAALPSATAAAAAAPADPQVTTLHQ